MNSIYNERNTVESNASYLTPKSLEWKEFEGGLGIFVLKPPEHANGLRSWSARVALEIPNDRVIMAAHIATKPEKVRCGDNVMGFHLPVKSEDGSEHLGDLVALTGIDGLTSDDIGKYRDEIMEQKDKLLAINPELPWDYPDAVIAQHQLDLPNSYMLQSFVTETTTSLRQLHRSVVSRQEWEGNREYAILDGLMEKLGWDLFNVRAQHNWQLYGRIATAVDLPRSDICGWNFRAPHGQVMYYFPSVNYRESWGLGGNLLTHRLQSLADVLASPIDLSGTASSQEFGVANVNLVTDWLIDELRAMGKTREQVSWVLRQKLKTQFDAFPVDLGSMLPLKYNGTIVRYPGLVDLRKGASVSTDGVGFKSYGNRMEGKPLWEIGEELFLLSNPAKPVEAYASKLDDTGFVNDDRAAITLLIGD